VYEWGENIEFELFSLHSRGACSGVDGAREIRGGRPALFHGRGECKRKEEKGRALV